MNGIICWLCLILAILALLPALQRWRNELNKDQEKNVSQQNRDQWWTWPQERLRSCHLQLLQTRGGPGMDIKILGNLLQVTIDQGNLRDRHHQVIQKRIMVNFGLLKSGKVELRRTIDRRKPEVNSWDSLQKVDPHHEEPLLDGNAHTVRYGETIHDGSGKLDSVNYRLWRFSVKSQGRSSFGERHIERIESLSQENKVSKFCMDAGFIHVVETGQYFMTEDTEEQFLSRACREYTLPRSDESSQPKGWIQGNTRIRPVLEITTSYLWSKYGIEIRIWSLSKDNSQSWVRISHGSNKFVIDSNYNTEVPADLPGEQVSQQIVKNHKEENLLI